MNSEIIRIGLSPCPNDTYIFDAMLHGKVDTEGLSFDPLLADVEELNRRAFAGDLDISKVSFHAFLHLVHDYILLDAGSALGRGCGPLLICREIFPAEEIKQKKIAIPGKYTTANLLLSLAFPEAVNKTELLFSEIENALLQNRFEMGVIIHENRFTYSEKGLVCQLDLGAFWEHLTGLPVPLGGIAVKRKMSLDTQYKLNRVMTRSVEYAFDHPESSENFVKMHAQELRDEVIRAHIGLYVTAFTLSLGEEGRNAIYKLFEQARTAGIINEIPASIFIG
jgi:1,4-dihydroxy-6-naphthoate synthase